MEEKERSRAELHSELVRTIVNMGYPAEFGDAIATQLGTENTMQRMIGYLNRMQPQSAEEIAKGVPAKSASWGEEEQRNGSCSRLLFKPAAREWSLRRRACNL